jgi:hypothetical protein
VRASGFSQAIPAGSRGRADCVDDLLDVFDAAVIRPRDPERLDRGIGDHLANRGIRLRLADVKLPRARGSG